MNGTDLRRMQDGFLGVAKKILLDDGNLRPVGFVVTLHKHVEKLLETGWGIEFIDPKACLRDAEDDAVATLIVDLFMDYKRLYHAVLNLFPQTRDVLPRMVALAEEIRVDDPYKRTLRPFLAHAQLEEKDVVAATMRHICGQVDAFACIMQTEAWLRVVDRNEDVTKIQRGLEHDMKSVEIILSSMESHDFTRMITVAIQREPSKDLKKRDEGKILGFGDPTETKAAEGRMTNFLRPLS